MMDVHEMEGMFVGLLDDAEIKALDQAVSLGLARRSYEGGGGLLGLAKVRLNAGAAVRQALSMQREKSHER